MDTYIPLNNQSENNYSSPPDMFIKVALVGGFDISDYREDYKHIQYFNNDAVVQTYIYRKNKQAAFFSYYYSSYVKKQSVTFSPFCLERLLSFEEYRLELSHNLLEKTLEFSKTDQENWKITVKI
jgi:hypothetical protein